MNKRFLGSILIALSLGVILFVATFLFAGSSTQAGPAISTISKVQGTAVPQNKGNSTTGSWADITPFPTISFAFPCGYPSPCTPQPNNVPGRIKRAGAAEYPPDGKIYFLGGRHGLDGNEDFPQRDIMQYDPVADTWTHKSAQLDGAQTRDRYVANMAVAVLTDTDGIRIYAIGGSSIDSIPTATVRKYDPNADILSTLTGDGWPANPARIPGGYAVYDNKLYIFGGFSGLGSGAVFTDTWRFDPMAAQGYRWTQLGNLNLGRAYMAGAVVDGKLYAIGGDTWDTSTNKLVPVSNVEMLDLTQPNPNWVNVASLPSPRGDLSAWAYDTGTGFQISGKIMVAGGIYPNPDSSSFLYDPGTNSWSSMPALVHATRNYAAAEWNGYLYALGGYDYSSNTPEGANFNQRFDATGPGSTPSPTNTGTPPTATATRTPPSATPTSCSIYAVATGTATIVPGTTNIGNSCDDCVTTITLPFSFRLYDQTFNSVNLSSNGNAQFATNNEAYSNECLPSTVITDYAIFPLWDDQLTSGTGEGIFTSTTGTAPNRIFNIEWRTEYYDGAGTANYELRLYESPVGQFDIIFGNTAEGNSLATSGVQKDALTAQQFFCDGQGPNPTNGMLVRYTLPQCATATITPTSPPASSATATNPPTLTPTTQPQTTETPGTAEPTSTATATPTSCPLQFTDVPEGSTFYPFVRCLACRGIINGYADNTFRPNNNITRGQLSKIVSNAAGFNDPQTTQMFQDVPVGDIFQVFINRLASRGFISGYACGGPGEPCGPGNLPYFRPNNNATRGQISKIDAQAAGFNDPHGKQMFQDVPDGSTFFDYINELASRKIVSGYRCGGPGEPCGPVNLPYFRPNANATRGQTAKIVSNTFFPACQTPLR